MSKETSNEEIADTVISRGLINSNFNHITLHGEISSMRGTDLKAFKPTKENPLGAPESLPFCLIKNLKSRLNSFVVPDAKELQLNGKRLTVPFELEVGGIYADSMDFTFGEGEKRSPRDERMHPKNFVLLLRSLFRRCAFGDISRKFPDGERTQLVPDDSNILTQYTITPDMMVGHALHTIAKNNNMSFNLTGHPSPFPDEKSFADYFKDSSFSNFNPSKFFECLNKDETALPPKLLCKILRGDKEKLKTVFQESKQVNSYKNLKQYCDSLKNLQDALIIFQNKELNPTKYMAGTLYNQSCEDEKNSFKIINDVRASHYDKETITVKPQREFQILLLPE